nr:MAG TPA: NinG recombination protein [Caudoviricetes sp.]
MANRALIKKLDRVFSQYIRLRDSHNGVFTCCSCGQLKPYEQADCGHFINRRWMALRYDERNCHAQCRSCNRFDEGNQVGYTRFMLKKYGEDTVDLLESMKIPYKWTDGELELLIKEYKAKVKELKHDHTN